MRLILNDDTQQPAINVFFYLCTFIERSAPYVGRVPLAAFPTTRSARFRCMECDFQKANLVNLADPDKS